MKRALAIAVALCTLGVAGFSQITGKWTGSVCLGGTFSSTLTLGYEVSGITLTSVSTFGTTGFTGQQFTMAGAFGPFSLSGKMDFDPVTPAYKQSDLSTGFDFGGIKLSLKVEHWAAAYVPAGLCTQTPTLGALRYTLAGTLAPITAKLTFLDCCTGTAFNDLTVTLTGLSLCCGVTYDAALYFTKAGFGYVSFTAKNFAAICCGISFDLSVKFTVDAKTVVVTPKFAGFGEACFVVYGNVESSGGTGSDLFLNAIRIDGFKISCTIADCNYIEFVTFLSPDKAGLYLDPNPFNTEDCGEFEYIGFGTCGSACCGGQYTVDMKIFFGTKGGLFDVTRMGGKLVLPVMGNLAVTLEGYVAAATCYPSSVCIGWELTF